jgi:hypothetical protein
VTARVVWITRSLILYTLDHDDISSYDDLFMCNDEPQGTEDPDL